MQRAKTNSPQFQAALTEEADLLILSGDVLAMPRDTLEEQTLESLWFAGPGIVYCFADSGWFVQQLIEFDKHRPHL